MGRPQLEAFPQGVLEKIAEFVGDIAIITSSQTADQVSENIIDSPSSKNWHPRYNDLRSLAVTSSSLTHAAQRALFRVVVVRTTRGLMSFFRALLLYPLLRYHVRYLLASISDHERSLPIRWIKSHPMVLREFMANLYILLSSSSGPLPAQSFLPHTLRRAMDTLNEVATGQVQATASQILRETGMSLHTIEDQVLTAAVQLCKNITGVRVCFGEPTRHAITFPPAVANPDQPEQIIVDPNQFPMTGPMPLYSSLLHNHPEHLTSLTLDFGAIYFLSTLKLFERRYPTGCPPSIERLTLVGNRLDSEIPYDLFTINLLAMWLRSNNRLRELRLVDDFDKMVRFGSDSSNNDMHTINPDLPLGPALNWNDILRSYADTLEVFEMGWHRPSALGMKAKFGEAGMLDCLPDMQRLKCLKAPLVTLGGEFMVPAGKDAMLLKTVRTGFPAALKWVDLLVVNQPKNQEGRENLTWRVVECRV